ncbi:Ig-like domain-containing protein [Acinetobacter sp. NIPH 1869]|uniref:Ig-like domain-containing protein n=1 Tax=Acinetobacter higginsii TaxID=70347 RepID=UPI001F4B9733|nr:Ig-like domain-containing protein [Acinetobacter higginsii]MCH7305435.1 Ig-like domain-containing protein [Acinetobacter higginsii]
MKRVFLLDKNNHKAAATSEIGIAGQTKPILLNQALLAKSGVNVDQISSITRIGNDAIVHLVDGTKVILEGFFVQDTLQLPLQDGESLWAAIVDTKVEEQPISDYLVLDGVSPDVLASDSSVVRSISEIPNAIATDRSVETSHAIATTASSTVGSIPTWAWITGSVAGVGAIAAASGGGGNGSKKNDPAPDTTAPVSPQGSFTAQQDGKTITGQAEISSTVIVKDVTGKALAETIVGADGKFSLTLVHALTNGEQLYVTAKDQAGNESTATRITAPDTTAPVSPQSSFTAQQDGKTITGQAEIGSAVIVKDVTGKALAETIVGADGKFSLTLVHALTNGEQLYVTAKDQAGNESTATRITAPDTTAPVAGHLAFTHFVDSGYSDTDYTTQNNTFDLRLTGQEQGTVVNYQVSKNGGEWTETVVTQKDLSDGVYQFKAIVTDQAGNSSEVLSPLVTVDKTPPQTDVLSFTDFTDTGVSATDYITNDQTFNLSLKGQEQGTVVSYHVSKNGGEWAETVVAQKDLSDGVYQFKAIVTDQAGNSSEVLSPLVTVDKTPPQTGVVSFTDFTDTGVSATDYITNDQTFNLNLKGQEQGTVVSYQVSKNGGEWTETVVAQKDLSDGVYQFKAIVTDQAGNSSELLSPIVTIDTTAPATGTLKIVNLNDTGNSPFDRITQDNSFDLQALNPIVINKEATFNNRYEVSKDGGKTWAETTAKQVNLADGTYLFKVVGTDVAGNIVETAIEKVVVDTVVPEVATKLKLVEGGSGSILTGTAEPDATIQVYDQNNSLVYPWDTTVNSDGTFAIDFSQYYLKEQTLTVTVTDRAGNVSEKVTIVAPLDNIKPEPIQSIEFNEDGRRFTAMAEANSIVRIYDVNHNEIGGGYADSEGKVSGQLSDVYLKGQQLSFIVFDRADNQSEAVTAYALNDNTPPEAATNLILVESHNGSILTGIAEANTMILVYDENNQLVYSWNNMVNADGTFAVYLNQYYLKGQILTVTVIDRAGNVSEKTSIVAPIDDINPNPIQSVEFDQDGRRFTAIAEANSTIKIYDANHNEVGRGSAGSDGKVSGWFDKVYLKGQQLSFIVFDRAGNQSETLSLEAINDSTPPDAAKNLKLTEGSDSSILTGIAEPNSIIQVYDQNNNLVSRWSSTAYSDGTFTVYLNQFYLNAQTLTVTVTDRAGNVSEKVTIVASLDEVAPLAAENITINEAGLISGLAESNARVDIIDQYGNLITTTVAYNGSFSHWINYSQYQTQTLSFVVRDSAGNRSDVVQKVLPILLNTPQAVSDLLLDAEGHNLSGQAVAGLQIIVSNAMGERVDSNWWNLVVNEDGTFNIQLNNYYLQGQTLYVRALDPTNSLYGPITEVIAPLDNIAPLLSEVVITENGDGISGQSEPKATIKVIDADGDVRAEFNTDETGHFNLSIYPPVLRGEQLFITATDLAKNVSTPVHIIFNADSNAPSPAENIFMSDNGFFISGDAVPDSYLKVVNAQGFLVGDIVVDKWGHFNIELNRSQATGEVLRVVVEQNGYQSNYTEVITPVDTVAPAAATQFAVNQSGYLTGHAEPKALVEITYNFDGQPSYTNTVIVKKEGIFEVYMNNKATSLAVTVIDSAGNQSAAVIIKPTEIPQIKVDQFRGDQTDNIYQVDHGSDFIQEYRIEHYENYKEVWVDDSHYVSQWFDGYYEKQWMEGHYEPVLIEGHYEEIWFDNGEWRYRDYYSDQDGKRYYTDDGSYDAYVNQYFDSELGLWQDGYALNGPEIEQEWVSNLYSEQIWFGDSYKDQWVEGHYENVWIERHEEYSWVESGYWENQLIESGYRDVDFGGHDKVLSSVSYSLMGNYDWVNDPESIERHLESGRYIEDLELVGSANINAIGNGLDNVITGNAGNNILDGRGGHDTYIGGAGSDTVIYNILNYSDGLVDRWQDFHVGNVWTDLQADKIDLTQLLTDYTGDGSTASLEKFIHVKQEGENTIVSIDRDGEASAESGVQLVVLNNVNTTLSELLGNHQIII